MRGKWIVVGAVVSLGAGCVADQGAPTGAEIRAPLFVRSVADADRVNTHLTPEEEVLLAGSPPVRVPIESDAQGQVLFRFNDDGTISFKLIAANIDNVFQAHIHCGAFGTNGPVRIWLYPVVGTVAPPQADLNALMGSGRHSGILAEGTFDPTGVRCPAPAGSPAGTLGPLLIDELRAGRTYVNVHTSDGVTDPVGPAGDYPGGEVRGQIDDHNHT